MSIERGHWVGGFAGPPAGGALLLADAAAANAHRRGRAFAAGPHEHRSCRRIDLCAQRLLGRAGSGWKMLAIDPEGCDLGRGESAFARFSFPRPATDTEELREIFGGADGHRP